MYLMQVSEAMQKLHDRKNIGKLVLDLALEPKPKPPTPVKGKKGNSIDKEDKKKEEEGANGVADQQQQQPQGNSENRTLRNAIFIITSTVHQFLN